MIKSEQCLFSLTICGMTFLFGTFLSLAQQRGRGGDSDLQPIDSWLMTQGMVRSQSRVSSLPTPAPHHATVGTFLLPPAQSLRPDRTQSPPLFWVPNLPVSMWNLHKAPDFQLWKRLPWHSAEPAPLGLCGLGCLQV